MKHYFSFDVESIGLFGPPFAVGFVVVDSDGTELRSGLYGWDYRTVLNRIQKDPRWSFTAEDQEWVALNVVKALPADWVNCEYQNSLYKKFFLMWKALQVAYSNLTLVTDCPFPVEANFLLEVLHHNGCRTMEHSPFPLIDLASALYTAGRDPMANYDRLETELPVHNPLADARQSVRLLLDVLDQIDRWDPSCKK